MVFINQSIVLISLPDIFRGIQLNPLTPGNTGYLLWMLMGFSVVLAVLVVTLGRVGDIFGRVKIFNLGFIVFTAFSLLLAVTWLTGTPAAIWLIAMRVGQGVGGAMLFANSSAIITDAFPADQRGLGLGINNTAAIAGSFVGLVLGGVLAPVQWHLVFLISVPFGILGTVFAYVKLEERGMRTPAKIDWLGNVDIRRRPHPRPDRDHLWAAALRRAFHGLDQPEGAGGDLRRHPRPDRLRDRGDQGEAADVPPLPLPHPCLLGGQRGQLPRLTEPRRPDVHADHLAPGDLAPVARLQLLRDAVVGGHLHDPVDGRAVGSGAPQRHAG